MRARGAAVVQPPEGSSTAPPVACRTPEPHAPACTSTAPPAHLDQARTHQHPHCPDTLSRISSPHSPSAPCPPSQSGMNINCTLQRGGGVGVHSAQGLGHRARRRVLAPALSPGILLRLQFPVRTSLPRETTRQVQPSPRSKVRGTHQGSGVGKGGFSADSDACDQMDL